MNEQYAVLPEYRGDDPSHIARNLRGALVSLSSSKGVPHLGSCLSCIDMMVAAYWRAMHIDPEQPKHQERDRFILSKGHAAKALYVCLAYRGFFEIDMLQDLAKEGGSLAEHPGPNCMPGVEAATGSLGHGLPIGVGQALAARIQGLNYRVFVLMSDGECNEGSVWEAAMLAASQKLGNLTVLIDYNGWQATGRSDEVMALGPLVDKWCAFGWSAVEIDGHDLEAVEKALNLAPTPDGKPRAIIGRTIKGKGISFMEDDNNWHYRIPNSNEVTAAFMELGLQ